MPCHVDPPSYEETRRHQLNNFLDEIGDAEPKSKGEFLGYSRAMRTDDMEARVVSWCESNNAATKSLELQIFWRDYQKRRKEEREQLARDEQQRALAKRARQKLTAQELAALESERYRR